MRSVHGSACGEATSRHIRSHADDFLREHTEIALAFLVIDACSPSGLAHRQVRAPEVQIIVGSCTKTSIDISGR